MHSILSNAWLIPLLPLLAAAWIALGYIFNFNRGESGEAQTSRTAITAITLSLLLVLFLDGVALLYGAPGQIRFMPWLESGDYRVLISFTLDTLGLVMATLVALIALLTIRFSVNYMHREEGYQRFFMILCLFTSAMLLIVMAGNAVLTFIGWELAGVSSYLLIAYAYQRDTATQNANYAFITNRVGDAAFIIAIAFSFIWLGSVEWSDILRDKFGLSSLHYGLIAGCFLIAALAKSALLPFSPWIARALEGPTPSSAIFYGSLMVHTGIYLVIRLEPMFMLDTALLPLLAIIGALTFAYGYLVGMVQSDVKSSLIFSVTSQVGLMLFLCGIGLFDIAATYMVLHAIYRAYQFLHAPAHMHLMTRPTREVSPLLQRFPRLYNACLQRFWLDNLFSWLIIKPTQDLSRDVRQFDEKVVTRAIGLPAQANAIAHMQQNRIGTGQGLAGKLMQWLASVLGWFEEHLVLKTGGSGLMKMIHHLGGYMLNVEQLLSQPKYLLILIIATFVVIL